MSTRQAARMDPGGDGHPDDHGSTCTVCGRVFASLIGRRVHERHSHPTVYHAAGAERLGTRPKARWDDEEVALMASFEAAHPNIRLINQAIQEEVLPHRTLDGIKGKRRQEAYKARVRAEVGLLATPRVPPLQHPSDGDRDTGDRPPHSPSPGRTPPPSMEDPGEEGGAHAAPSQDVSITPAPPECSEATTEQEVTREVGRLSQLLGVAVPTTSEDIQYQLRQWAPIEPASLRRTGRPRPSRPPGRSVLTTRMLRCREYARFQEAYKKNRGRAITDILAGRSPGGGIGDLPPGTVQFWREVFERPSPGSTGQLTPVNPGVGHLMMAPVKPEEVMAAFAATKADTAAGPDGRTLSDLRALSTDQLLWLMDSAIMLGSVPESWVHGRTVLLPKVDAPRTASDYRPLTIAPILTRTFHRVLSQRLATHAPLPLGQKGFRREEGCAANLLLVRRALEAAKSTPRSLYMVFIDFKKAFDSVGHPAIVNATRRWGLGERFANYIGNVYAKASTDLDENTRVEIGRGVMQGDPLSPLLFNLTLDQALSALPQNVGVELGGRAHGYLAFADDVVLLASTRIGLEASLRAMTSAAAALGLEVGPSKCASVGVVADGKNKTWFQDKIRLHAGGEEIRSLGPEDFYKYLGSRVGAAWASGPSHLLGQLIAKLGRLQRAPAKPQQKHWGLASVLLPQMLYPLLHSRANKGALKRMDVEIRKFVRIALHLPHDTPLGYFHAAGVDGGLGVTALESRIPRLKHDLLARLRQSHDPAVRAVAEGASQLDDASTPSGRKREERSRWSENLYGSVDGRGLRGATQTPVSAAFLDGSALMKGGIYSKAVRLRGALLPTKSRSARGRLEPDVMCDLCFGRRVHSLGHILQQCPAVAGARTLRHNTILDGAVQALQQSGYRVLKEHPIPTPAGLRYPDIVCWRGNRSWVIDVQVVADSAAADLHVAHERKVSYYNVAAVTEKVKECSGYPPVVSSLTLSWRGVVAPASANTWSALGLSKAALKLAVVRALEGGVRIYQAHRNTAGAPVARGAP